MSYILDIYSWNINFYSLKIYLIKFFCHSSDDLRVLHVAEHFSTDHTW